MKLLLFNGPPCAGKSTIIEKVLVHQKRFFYLSYDHVKWQFSEYQPGTNTLYQDIRILRLALLRDLCDMQYNVITYSLHRETREKHIAIARSYGYDSIEINLEASYEALIERLNERMARGLRKERITRERFDEMYQIYMSEKNTQATTFRTDLSGVEEIAERIGMLL